MLFLAAAISSPSAGAAQTIQGVLVNEKSHQPIGYAHVSLVDDSGHVIVRDVSDSVSGAFYLNAPKSGRYAVRIVIGRGGLSQSPFFPLDSNQTVERAFAVPAWPESVLNAYLADDVAKTAAYLPDQPRPRYPDRMRTSGHVGLVRARFVIDSTGRADMSTFQVIASDDRSFTDAVSSTVSRSRYLPAERDGHKVAQVCDIAVDFGFANDPPRATGDNLIVVRAFGVTRRVTGTP
jgi:hypothetical protein